MSPRLRAWVTQELDKAGVSRGTRRQKGQAILDAYRAKVPYIADPVMGEFMATPDQTLCLDDGGLCIIGADCFPEGTLLLRDDFVFVPIEAIKVGERIWGNERWSTVTEKWANGQLTVDAIEMSNGSTMHLTPDHKVYVGACKHGGRCDQVQCRPAHMRVESFDQRVHVSDLREGDTLLQPKRVSFGSGKVNADRMYVEALALEDGWTKASKNPELPHLCFYVAGRDGKRKEAQKHEVKAICERLKIDTLWHERYITIKDREWASRIAELGSRARFKHLETINLDESGAASALKGLMADSTKNTFGATRTFSTTSRQLMLQIRVL
ncbi:MAG: Hint domain-containing protein, partial [Candidatus Aminicenantales bacterium]